MNKRIPGAMAGILGSVVLLVVSPGELRANIIVPAVNNATIQPAGPRTGANGKQFFNMEGSGNGMFASFGVVDFQSGPMNVAITSLTIDLTQDNAAFTNNGTLIFYLSTDTATNIEPGTSPLIYNSNSADLPTGIGTQLSPLLLLGTGIFTQVTTGTIDSFSFSPDSALTSYLSSQLSTGGPIRLVIAPGDASVAATYAGFSNTEFGGPELLLATPVPEPGTLVGTTVVLLIFMVGRARVRSRPHSTWTDARQCRGRWRGLTSRRWVEKRRRTRSQSVEHCR
jgi:hypothetical protein